MSSRDNDTTGAGDGLACLALLARFHGIAINRARLEHEFGRTDRAPDTTDLLQACIHAGLRARAIRADWERLAGAPMPAMARMRDGGWVLVAAADADTALVQHPREARPQRLKREAFTGIWSGELIIATRRDAHAPGKLSGIGWFLPAIARYRGLLGEVLLASFVLQLLALATPIVFQIVIDKVLTHRGLTTLDVLTIGLLGIALFEVLLGTLRGYLFAHTSSRIDVELGAGLFRHLLQLPLAYFDARRTGDTVARVRELETIRHFLTSSALTVVVDLAFIGLFLLVMGFYSGQLLLVVLATLPGYALLAAVVTPRLRARLDEKFSRGADSQAFLVELVAGIETLKGLAAGPALRRQWEERLAGYVRATFSATHLGNLAGQAAALLQKVTVAMILWFGARLVIDGQLTIGQLIAFNMLAGRVSGPVLRMVQLWQEFQQAVIAVRRVADIQRTPAEPGHGTASAALPQLRGRVSLEHVGFRYAPDGSEVLRDITLDAKPGEIIGFAGRSGSGKSTLARLLLRLYLPVTGRIRYDGIDGTQLDPEWLRRHIGLVGQECRLFGQSIRDNIALATPGIPFERVEAAARLAGAHDFIAELPAGYETQVGEFGTRLSGGQRQRIAIARALIADPRILILDEATSALDYESEQILRANLQQICRDRTVFIIAHRLSLLVDATRILFLDRGRIVEQGSHDELLAHGGHYARLHACQAA